LTPASSSPTFVAIVYFVCCYALSLASAALERRFAVPDGGGGEPRAGGRHGPAYSSG